MDFSSEAHKERYAFLSKLPVNGNRYIDYNDLALVGLKVEVKRLVDGIGWDYFIHIREPKVKELLLEFLTTFEFFKMPRIDYDWEDSIVFRLGGIIHHMSISEFKVNCGFYDEDILETDQYISSIFWFHEDTMFPNKFWHSIAPYTEGVYRPRKSKSTGIVDLTLHYLHRFITYSLDRCGDSNGVISKLDFFFLLWCLKSSQPCNLGCCFALYFEKMAEKCNKVLCGGSYVTRLDRNLGVFNRTPPLEGLTTFPNMVALDIKTMTNMKMVKREGIQYILIKQRPEDEHREADEPKPD